MLQSRYQTHDVVHTRRADGAIFLHARQALGPVANRTTDWLDHWAQATPDAVFLAERSGAGWREVGYLAAQQQARALAAGLLDLGLGPDKPIMVISGNGVDHGLLALAAQYVGVPIVPVAEQYALIPEARKQLDYVAGLTRPGLIFAENGTALKDVLQRDSFAGAHIVVSRGATRGMISLDALARMHGDISSVHSGVGPDTVAKILMTSGSTSAPKGVLTTHKMMCTNQTQIAQALPFLAVRPPRIVDWLPWNHVFGGSHNFNLMLANGGALYVDNGKPVPVLVDKSIENLRLKTGTLAFNVPIGFAKLRDVMRNDHALRQAYFEELDMLFYSGASLPQDVWADLEAMARDVRGEMPLFTSSWGLTETAPAVLLQHEPTDRSGIVGVPLPGVEVKLIPQADMRYEIRVKGPNIFAGYFDDPAKSASAFDAEGYFCTGDAMKFLDPENINLGLRFDGRISEDFKLMTGTWVRAANLRLEVLAALGPDVADVVLTGVDRAEIGVMIVPSALVRTAADTTEDAGALLSPEVAERIASGLARVGTGSSTSIARALILAEPPQIADGEVTAKGNLNFNKILTRRADMLARLYDNKDPATILIAKDAR
jgi:feruloyl-CoA synthase